MRFRFPIGLTLAAAAMMTLPALADTYSLTIKDHRFTPNTLKVKANQEFDLTIANDDPTAEEFESSDLNIEKVINGGKQVTIHIGPLAAGSYGFFGERHEDTAIGTLVAE